MWVIVLFGIVIASMVAPEGGAAGFMAQSLGA